MDRAEHVHERFLERVGAADFPTGLCVGEDVVGRERAIGIFRSQCVSRHLDRMGRKMQKAGQGYYTIGSSGHEGMAAVAAALRPDDLAFLHYRDAAFQIERSSQLSGVDPVRDILLSFACSVDDPVSGGRHKVLGSKELMIPPQTSTIASHLPKAVGAAYSIGLAKRLKPEHQRLAPDSIVMCSFGDASANHSTAQGAFNTACWTSFQSVPMPLLFVCEDNGIGISVKTPSGWIATNFTARPGLKYMRCNGLDLFDAYRVAKEAADHVRTHRKPVFLHVETVRLYGHAGSDLEAAYLSREDIERAEANDPLVWSAGLLDLAGYLSPDQAVAIYNETEAACEREMSAVITAPRLRTGKDVAASLIPPVRLCNVVNGSAGEARARAFGADAKALAEPQPMAKLINWALTDLMLQHGEIVVAGEDIGAKGGVYGVTQKLADRFGRHRVIDTILDEQSILGLAIGMAHNGLIPIPEIQFLAYLHNAEDQLRGEAATLSFFSNGQFTNPMVVRIAGLGYQKGFGGHFHNDNSLAVLRDIPGLIVACPSNGADAAMMLRECVRLAREEQRVVVFIEPIALYPMRDLHDEKDGLWMRSYPVPGERIPFGQVGVDGEGTDLAIVTYGNGCYLAHQARSMIEDKLGATVRIVDIRWLAPLPEPGILKAIEGVSHVLIVDECRRTGSQSEALMALLAENDIGSFSRLTADDCFIATGPAYAATLPSTDGIVAAAQALLAGG
ncbi:dehydrogenase E1 component subunit alpha/beta [Oricola cellulosilytica]|uniref:2-oxoglutarate dehydrogenase E1 component n=1 Tax=Oricola cellulosilytica TaxID=1429082 RepID=A0A4R0PBP5_9HYPH|nr:thiamine pyrophosphate-dependent enzyme [Oricola cellulosilytica]TCD14872.1 MFS transporter [Oricola cellulosilytica]